MNTKINSAPKASKKSKVITSWLRYVAATVIVGILETISGCASREPLQTASPNAPTTDTAANAGADHAATLQRGKSRWVAVAWSELPNWGNDALDQAWGAWLKSCERVQALPHPAYRVLCPKIRQLTLASHEEQRTWLEAIFQPYRVSNLDGQATGLLTAYFEPELLASRTPSDKFNTPLYTLPSGFDGRGAWFTRQEMETQASAQTALQGRAIAYVADPLDALSLQIQGSGRLRMLALDGTERSLRLAFAGSNNQPYRSVGRWLLDQKLTTDASWRGIKNWAQKNPNRVQELLWQNPRVIFFKEEPVTSSNTSDGPKGALGVALTPMRSIAVDPQSIPYGTPVWLVSTGPVLNIQQLVQAQDTGSAITGAVRADLFMGKGDAVGEAAGQVKQNLQMWVLWPK